MKRKSPLEIVKIPTPPGSDHPPPPNELLPVHEFTMGLIAPKGKGKTTTIINLLEFYGGYFHKIFVLSPTVKSDVKWEYAKQLKVLAENTALKKWLINMANPPSVNSPIQPAPIDRRFAEILDEMSVFQEEIPENCFFHGNEVVKAVREMLDRNKEVVDLLHAHGQLKTMADRILLICDDQVGSDLFSGKLKKYFVGANTRHRHHSASIIMVSQGKFYYKIRI